jgi:hypothetical protein
LAAPRSGDDEETAEGPRGVVAEFENPSAR